MSSLKETKGRIASVRSTLKITSAMKLVSSAKLRKAQQAIGNMLPYERNLMRVLLRSMESAHADALKAGKPDRIFPVCEERPVERVTIVAVSSNSSLCGGFNANVIRETFSAIDSYRAENIPDSCIKVIPVGRKVADALKREGFDVSLDRCSLSGKPDYHAAALLTKALADDFLEHRTDRIELIYSHYKSTSSQPVVRETFLPLALGGSFAEGKAPTQTVLDSEGGFVMPVANDPEDYIIEPDVNELISELLPKELCLKLFSILLDSSAAEHAARTVAMQTATDNGNDLLQELTLEYNKGRQQKITNEILDLVGGSMN